MTLRDHARSIIQDELEMLERGRRVNGFPNCAKVQQRDLKGLRSRTFQRLKASKRYGSLQLIWFFLSLASLILEVIKWRDERLNNDTRGIA